MNRRRQGQALRRHCVTVVGVALIALPAGARDVPAADLEGAETVVRKKLEALARRVTLSPEDGARWGRYAMALDAHEFVELAGVCYGEAAELDRSDFRWPYHRAILLETADASAAVAWFERALEIDASYAPGQIRYGELLERLDRSADAARRFETAVRLDPDNPFGHFGLGRIALSAGRTDDALRLLGRAYALEPRVKALLATLSQAYFRDGQRDLAQRRAAESRSLPRITYRRDPIRAAVNLEAVDSNSNLRRATSHRTVGRIEDAQREIEEALKGHPEHAEAHFVAAEIYDSLGKSEEAVAAARRTLELAPGLESVRAILAGNLLKLRRFDEATIEAKRVLVDHPDDVRMWLTLAMISIERADFESLTRSIDEAAKASIIDRASRELLLNLLVDLAATFGDAGQFDEAARRMEVALRLARGTTPAGTRVSEYERQLQAFRARRNP